MLSRFLVKSRLPMRVAPPTPLLAPFRVPRRPFSASRRRNEASTKDIKSSSKDTGEDSTDGPDVKFTGGFWFGAGVGGTGVAFHFWNRLEDDDTPVAVIKEAAKSTKEEWAVTTDRRFLKEVKPGKWILVGTGTKGTRWMDKEIREGRQKGRKRRMRKEKGDQRSYKSTFNAVIGKWKPEWRAMGELVMSIWVGHTGEDVIMTLQGGRRTFSSTLAYQ